MSRIHTDDQQRRDYWIDYMNQMDQLVVEVLAYPYEESGEPLKSIPEAFDAAGVEALFSATKIDGKLDRIYYIRENLLDSLIAIAREMSEKGWILKIEDGFRTQEMQTRLVLSPTTFDFIVRTCLWECQGEKPSVDLVFRRARVLIANYGKLGTHTQGAAVDISVFRRDDRSEVWRGKSYLEMSEYTPMESPFITQEERDNRREITTIMERHGFIHFPGEFWHYNSGDVLAQILTKSNQPGRYGPIHVDLPSGSVTPYDDPMAPLIPIEQMEGALERALQQITSAEVENAHSNALNG
jgi:D-alanyl-D-alanine dipeptidase